MTTGGAGQSHPPGGHSMKSHARCSGAIAAMLGAAGWLAAPMAAHATLVTFDWVPISENPTSAQTTTPSGSITLNIPGWVYNPTAPSPGPPNYGPYYWDGSSSAVTATIEAISYTAGDGQTFSWTAGGPTTGDDSLNVTSVSAVWATSSIDTPASASPLCAGCSAPTAGYYLITQFPGGSLSISGTTAQGAPIMFANNVGTAGATYQNGIANGDVTVNAAGSYAAIEDGGYWELAPVPLPAGLPLLLSGLALVGGFARFARRGLSLAAVA